MSDDFKPIGNVSGDAAPKRRGRPPGSRNKASRANLKKDLEGLITLANTVVVIAAPADALDPVEVEALAAALDEQAKANPRFRRMLENAISVAGGTSLITVVGIIVTRRLARHGVVPGGAMIDTMLGGVIRMATMPPQQAAAAVEATARQMAEAMAGTNDNSNASG